MRPRLLYFPSMSRSAVRVLAFGRYAEVLGAETLEIDLLPGATVRDMLQVIRERPGGNLLPQQVLCAVNLGQVDAVSDETVRRTLKKGRSNRGKSAPGASPR